MTTKFEAIVETNDGEFRASYISENVIGIRENGRSELIDYVVLDGNEVATNEYLIHNLIIWIYEMRRGLDIKIAKISGVQN